MAFLRVAEVVPPPFHRSRAGLLGAGETLDGFVAEVRRFGEYADIFLVANVKTQAVLKADTVHLAARLENEAGVGAAPVVVVRDQNRPQFLSAVLTALTAGSKSVMVAWGDRYHDGKASNVRDFKSLAGAVAEADSIRRMMRSPSTILAPVNIERLSDPSELSRAKGRLRAGADLLLAQPPTTDADRIFERHTTLLDEAGLRSRVLLNVFPFTGPADVARYERLFGWRLPAGVHKAARGGPEPLLGVQRDIVRRMREENLPGVYLSTRGDIGLTRTILS